MALAYPQGTGYKILLIGFLHREVYENYCHRERQHVNNVVQSTWSKLELWRKMEKILISMNIHLMNIHINEYFLYFAWGCSTLSKGLTTDDINPCPNKAMQLDPCVKVSRDPRYRSNRPNSQRCRPATDAGWKQRPRWCSTTQTRTTRSRLRRAGAATTTTTTTRRMRTPGNTRRPMALQPANFVNEIKHQGYIPNFANGFLFEEKVPFDLISIKNEGWSGSF